VTLCKFLNLSLDVSAVGFWLRNWVHAFWLGQQTPPAHATPPTQPALLGA
jgi:hypothetical protein